MKVLLTGLSLIALFCVSVSAEAQYDRGHDRGGWGRDRDHRGDWGRDNDQWGRPRPRPVPPRPVPPRPIPPAPVPAPRDLCQGTVNGVWGYKGGRAMTLTLARQGAEQVVVTIVQANGGEAMIGTCRYSYDGSATLSFAGTFNNGYLTIQPYGAVSGVVSGFSYTGTKY